MYKKNDLIARLIDEKEHGIKGGIYHKLQVDMAYNSNHMEGNTLTHDQTRYIFETHTIDGERIYVDDVIETANHFRCFDYILDTYQEKLTLDYIKELHRILKTGTLSSNAKEAVVGDFKKYGNYAGDQKTSSPKNVPSDLQTLMEHYYKNPHIKFDDILDFHAKYELIHPFYDGNGRTGRLLMFKECINHDIIPFVLLDEYKLEYYRGLKEWQNDGEKGYLRDTCLYMQDIMKSNLEYFGIDMANKNINDYDCDELDAHDEI